MGADKNPLVTAIVTNYNGWELGVLPEFFKAFLDNDYENFELFFVDNASTDDSVRQVKKNFGKDKRLKIIENPVNNMSAGINMAVERARGNFILFLNNDLYFKEGGLGGLVKFLQENKKAALVQGKIVSYYDHEKIDDVGETMDLYGNPETLGAGENDKGQYDKKREVLSVTGASSLFRASLVDKIGMLDSDYGIGYEDMDLAIRARIAAYKAYYIPEVTVYHRRAASTSSVSTELRIKLKYGFNKNRLATLIKNYQASTLFKSLPVIVLIYIATGLFEMFYKRLWAFGLTRFKALGWVVLNLPTLLEKRRKVQTLRKLSDKEALFPFMAKGKMAEGFKNFIGSKKW